MVFTQEQKRTLPNGSPVINCHIQKGANISDSLVKKSFDQAKVFFKDHFPSTEYKAFLCYSWLLYPPMLNMLPKDSNIKQFAKHFSIIGACNDSEQAKENLFDYASIIYLANQQLYKGSQKNIKNFLVTGVELLCFRAQKIPVCRFDIISTQPPDRKKPGGFCYQKGFWTCRHLLNSVWLYPGGCPARYRSGHGRNVSGSG